MGMGLDHCIHCVHFHVLGLNVLHDLVLCVV